VESGEWRVESIAKTSRNIGLLENFTMLKN
jgi:hypothetical protein